MVFLGGQNYHEKFECWCYYQTLASYVEFKVVLRGKNFIYHGSHL